MVTPSHTWTLAAAALVGSLLAIGSPTPEGAGAGWASPSYHAGYVAEHDAASAPDGDPLFLTSDRCIACHQGVTTSAGLDVSIGLDWRASMMANSARDPYWQAAVRREVIDYPEGAATIEAKCSRCHMPMTNEVARAGGGEGAVFANLSAAGTGAGAPLAADGVACAVCHQITPEGLGTESSFTGEFRVSPPSTPDARPMFGPFEPDSGGVGIMRSATGFEPTEAPHVQSSELCASCHTLFTHAVLEGGGEGPEFPEQVPYLEWRASSYAVEGTSCQDCHMPVVEEDVPVTRILGRARADVSRHVFRGGNFFMLRMLNRYRAELGVAALPQELSLAADRTEEHLREATASLRIVEAAVREGRLEADLEVRNLTGHKFPTAYPSRRAWLHVTVADAAGRTVFESGAFAPDGSIVGNDNDEDATRFERHYERISAPDQVQIYEGVMVDGAGAVTTGLMSAQGWAKENRLLPRGFDAEAGGPRVAVVGDAARDANFTAGADRIGYAVSVDPAAGPFRVRAELWFQPIGFRWAENLVGYDAFETERFLRYYREMAVGSAIELTAVEAIAR